MKTIHPAIAEHALSRVSELEAENEKLRGLLRQLRALLANSSYRISGTAAFLHSIDAALSQKAEPTDTFTAVDMATAAAQGFRDGQAAVEPAPAQDEREAFEQHYHRFDLSRDPVSGAYLDSEVRCLWDAWQARATRPAQTEQHPDVKSGNPDLWSVTAGGTDSDMEYVVVRRSLLEAIAACEWRGEMAASSGNELRAVMAGRISYGLYPAPVAQTAPQPEQSGLVEALEEIASGLQAEFAWEVAEQALAAYRAALSAQGASK